MLYKHPQPLPLIPAKEDILPTAQRHVVEKKRTIDAIINNVDISDARFETVLFPIANLDNKQSGEKAIISALRYASPDAETQHTAEEAEKLWLELDGYVFGRLDLFKLVKGVKEKNESLDPESAWLLNRTLLRYGQCGHGVLDEAGITNWHARNSEIEDLCAKFNGNVRGYVPTDLCFTDDELDGVPDGDLHGYPLDADGKRRVSLQWNNFETICRYAHSPKTRKSISLAWGQRLSKNVPLFRRAILLRDENARLLGYKSHADYGIPHRMTESAECVEKMITRLTYSLTAEAKANFTRILRKKQELVAREQPTDVVTEDVVLERFDISYYNKFINQQNGVDHEKIMEYFPLQHTFPLILGIYASYWQLRYERIEKTDLIGHVWHEDVSVWSVWDERPASKGEFIGYLYADMVERQNKYRGNQCVNIQPCYVQQDGRQVCPATALMCNFSPSKVHGVVLLKHGQVKTIFHELGHCMHDLLSRHKFVRLHAWEGSLEFGEAVATMLENWAWMKDILQNISCHYTYLDRTYRDAWVQDNPGLDVPSKLISNHLIDPWLSKRREDRIDSYNSQLCHASFDLAVHNPPSREALIAMDETKVYLDLDEKYNFVRRPEPYYLHSSFTHLMSGYDGGYYAYVLANVLAEELFQSTFAHDHTCPAAWERFRRGILEYGASQDQRLVLEKYLRRQPNADALLSSLGINVPAGERL